jgi:hypothetical protein
MYLVFNGLVVLLFQVLFDSSVFACVAQARKTPRPCRRLHPGAIGVNNISVTEAFSLGFTRTYAQSRAQSHAEYRAGSRGKLFGGGVRQKSAELERSRRGRIKRPKAEERRHVDDLVDQALARSFMALGPPATIVRTACLAFEISCMGAFTDVLGPVIVTLLQVSLAMPFVKQQDRQSGKGVAPPLDPRYGD